MDRLDGIGMGLVVVLAAGAAAVWRLEPAPAVLPVRAAAVKVVDTPEVAASVAEARDILERGNLERCALLAEALLVRFPGEAGPHLLKAEVLMRKQEALAAVMEYRVAVDLEPDYLDRRTPLFEGKKIKVALAEAAAELERQGAGGTLPAPLLPHRKALHYLQRRMAGSCG